MTALVNNCSNCKLSRNMEDCPEEEYRIKECKKGKYSNEICCPEYIWVNEVKMKCPSCGSPDVAWSGTYFKGKKYDRACNKCGRIWNIIMK